jgi:alpha-tubulin suppressor-like RCC1 family protein
MFSIKSVAVGESHCIFLLEDGSLWGVGSNEFGQLGFPFDSKHPSKFDEMR